MTYLFKIGLCRGFLDLNSNSVYKRLTFSKFFMPIHFFTVTTVKLFFKNSLLKEKTSAIRLAEVKIKINHTWRIPMLTRKNDTITRGFCISHLLENVSFFKQRNITCIPRHKLTLPFSLSMLNKCGIDSFAIILKGGA